MRDELMALAERALGFCDGEAQVTAWWERQLTAAAGGAITTEAHSGPEAVESLPEPALARMHDGFDPAVLSLDPAERAVGDWASWRAAAAGRPTGRSSQRRSTSG